MALKTLAEVAEITSGRSFKEGVQPSGEGAYVVGMADVSSAQSGIDWSQVKKATLTLRTHKPLLNGDILFLAKGSLNKAIVVDGLDANAVATHHFFVIRPLENIDSEFIAFVLNSPAGQDYFHRVAKGEQKKHITKQDLANFAFVGFKKSEQLMMSKLLSGVQTKFVDIERQRELFDKAWGLFTNSKAKDALLVLNELLGFQNQYFLMEVESLHALINRALLEVPTSERSLRKPKI